MATMHWMLLLIGVLMSAVGGLFLKIGAVQVQYDDGVIEIFRQVMFNWTIVIGVLMYFIPVLIWIFLLKRVELSFLQPLFSMVYVVTPVLASIFLNENVTTARWLGIGAIIVGVIIVARS
ncbi:MAG: EamA family transporter [Acidobacteriota bacterium]